MQHNCILGEHWGIDVPSRLIALDKYLGVQPTGIEATLRRVLAKAVAFATHLDAKEGCRTDQLCVGARAGIEGAIHAIHQLFERARLMVGVYYLLMPRIHLTPSIRLLLYGMYVFFGQDVLVSCLIPIKAGLNLLSREQLSFYITRRV